MFIVIKRIYAILAYADLLVHVLLSLAIRGDPLQLLINFLNDRGIRLVDLFRTFDKDKEGQVSKDHFISGLKVYVYLY